jgi:hypothetical protein
VWLEANRFTTVAPCETYEPFNEALAMPTDRSGTSRLTRVQQVEAVKLADEAVIGAAGLDATEPGP